MTERRSDTARGLDEPLVERLRRFGMTIFSEMTERAVRHGAVNLGQGFPEEDGPEAVLAAACEAIRSGRNQYCRSAGVIELVEAIARHRERFFHHRADPLDEITVFAGATEGIHAALQALCAPGDEVVLFEPFYDSYLAAVAMAGGVARTVALEPPGLRVDPARLADAIGPRTRIIVVNTPHNPTGRVFDDDELGAIAEIAVARELIVLTDEVYEHLVYEGVHRPLATWPGMSERTVTISSTGKTFSLTGWKVGFALAPPPLTRALRTAHQFITFCVPEPFQHAMAVAFDLDAAYFEQLAARMRRRRDLLSEGLGRLGFGVLDSASGYFLLTDIRPLGEEDGVAFCRELPRRAGVAAIPVASFCLAPERVRHLVRWAFCKPEPMLREALARLARWRRGGGGAAEGR